MRVAPRLISLLVLVLALVLLFALQFVLCAINVFPEWAWLAPPEHLQAARAVVALNAKAMVFGAVPSAFAAFGVARGLRRLASSGTSYTFSPLLVVAIWALAWSFCWLVLYVLFGGVEPNSWSGSIFMQPAAWYGFASVALGLYLGAGSRTAGRVA